jgi:hypothetical protein
VDNTQSTLSFSWKSEPAVVVGDKAGLRDEGCWQGEVQSSDAGQSRDGGCKQREVCSSDGDVSTGKSRANPMKKEMVQELLKQPLSEVAIKWRVKTCHLVVH